MHPDGLRLSQIDHEPCPNLRASDADDGERGARTSHCVDTIRTIGHDQHIDPHHLDCRRMASTVRAARASQW